MSHKAVENNIAIQEKCNAPGKKLVNPLLFSSLITISVTHPWCHTAVHSHCVDFYPILSSHNSLLKFSGHPSH